MPDPLAAAVLDEIAHATRRPYALIERFGTGENQSTYLLKAGQEQLVLKLEPPERLAMHERGARVCAYLLGLGYPVAHTVAVGVAAGRAYTLRTRLPGVQLSPQDGRHADRLIELVELHAGGAQPAGADAGDWPASVVGAVLFGGAGFCLLETMRAHSDETARLLERLQALVAVGGPSLPEATDILHYDYNPANILVEHGRVSGVVDWDGVRAGDRAFDLATLLYYGYDAEAARTALWTRLRELRALPVIGVYLAHIILRQVEWSLRLHTPEVARRYLERAYVVLRDLSEA